MNSIFLNSIQRVLKDDYRSKNSHSLIENNKGRGGKHFKMRRKQLEMSEGFAHFILTRVETLCGKINENKFFIRKIGLKDTACPQKMGTLGYPSLTYNKNGYMLLHKDFDVNLPLLMDASVD